MPLINTPRNLGGLSALLLPLFLIGCATASVRPVKPAAERVAEVPGPEIPEGSIPCAYDSAQRCLDDVQNATVIDGLAGALDAANAKLHWLAIFFGLSD